VQRRAGEHDVKAGIVERQLACVGGQHLDAIGHSFDHRVVQRRRRFVAAEILGLPDVDANCPTRGQSLGRADQEQPAPASHVQHALVPAPFEQIVNVSRSRTLPYLLEQIIQHAIAPHARPAEISGRPSIAKLDSLPHRPAARVIRERIPRAQTISMLRTAIGASTP
jgi:hypothetical protein